MKKLNENQKKFLGTVPKKYQLVETFWDCPEISKTSNKGITLIALIITIIVMLILVGVTINVALDGNLFGKAETAKKETEEQAILEEMLAMMEITDEGKFAYDTIIANMRTKHPEYTIAYSYPNATITGKLGKYNYIVSETEIRIGSSKSDVDEDLEKYIMGADKKGRFLIESDEEGNQIGIINEDTGAFQDDPLTEDVDETKTLGVEFLMAGQNEDATKRFIYAKYDNKAYKITCDTTFKSEKLEIIYEPKGTEGQTTAEGWTILYDNGTTAEAVSPTAMGNLRLGYAEGTTDSDTKLAETIESYNNAIDIINTYCSNLIGLPTNTGVRSVGGASETSDASDNKYRSDNLATWNSAYNGVGKKGDILFEQDLLRMVYWEVNNVGTDYWMASRLVIESDSTVRFDVWRIDSDGVLYYGSDPLWDVDSNGKAYCTYFSCGVRPIITIENL